MNNPTPDDIMNANLAEEMVKRTDKLLDTSIDLALRVKQARDFLAWNTAHIRTCWIDWQEEAKKAGQDINLFRMAFDRETKTVIGAGKDVKEFFNSPEYTQAHAKLAEMVTLLDRFAALKANGTLDAFADFILKVTASK